MTFYDKDGVIVRSAREADVQELKGRLRRADADEIIAAGNESEEAALQQSFSRSELRYSVVLGDIVVAMFGVVPDAGGTICGGVPSANVWFLGTEEMSSIRKTFVKLSRVFIEGFLKRYPMLWNLVDARYKKTFPWLKACGARFGESVTVLGHEFVPFIIVRGS